MLYAARGDWRGDSYHIQIGDLTRREALMAPEADAVIIGAGAGIELGMPDGKVLTTENRGKLAHPGGDPQIDEMLRQLAAMKGETNSGRHFRPLRSGLCL